MGMNTVLATLAGISLAADVGIVINPALDKDLGVPKLESALYTPLGQRASSTSVEFRSAKVSEVFNWLKTNGFSFVVNDSDVNNSKTISLNVVNQPIGAVAEAIASALGGHWETSNGIHVFKKGSLGMNWMKVPSEGSMIWGGELPGKGLSKDRSAEDMFGPEFQMKIQQEASPEFQKNFMEKFGPDFAKKIKEQFGPEFQKKMKEGQGEDFGMKFQNNFGPEFQKKIEEQFGPKFQKHIEEMVSQLQKQHALTGSKDSEMNPELELKLQKQMEEQFGPKFQKQIEEQFGPKFQKHMEEMASQLQKQHARSGSKELDMKMDSDFELKLQKQMEEQFGPKFQKHIEEMVSKLQMEHARGGSKDSDMKMDSNIELKLQMQMEEQFGPKFQKRMEELGAQMEKEMAKGHLQSKGEKLRSNDHVRMFSVPHLQKGNSRSSNVNADSESFNGAHFLNTLSPDQKDQQRKQGYIWYTDLTSDQKRMFDSFSGKFDIKVKVDGEEVRVRRN